jgi:PiT family inorganic phosphate transporter
MDPTTILLILATIGGLYLTWNIGANDVANAMGTAVGSGALTLRRAIVLAAIFDFAGAFLAGGKVSETIGSGLLDTTALDDDASLLAVGMTCALLSTVAWTQVATYFGWPVSTTHSIVGAVVGMGIVAGGLGAVEWPTLGAIATSWIVSPIAGGLLGFAFFLLVKRLVLAEDSPLRRMRALGPAMVFPIAGALAFAITYDGLGALHLELSAAAPLSIAIGVGVALLSIPYFRGVTAKADGLPIDDSIKRTESVFGVLQILTACVLAFAHGSNDVANAVGPLAVVYNSVRTGVLGETTIPISLLLIGSLGLVVGIATYGFKVMDTIGAEITVLTPSRGFAAELAAALTILAATKLGLPVSATHTIVGAIVGVGLARSIGAVDAQVLRGIVTSWVITIPITALLGGLTFAVVRSLL